MWIDESLSFFFRRLTFSPDGNLLVVPGPFVVVVVYATVYCYCLLMHVLDSKIVLSRSNLVFMLIFYAVVFVCVLLSSWEIREKTTNMTYIFTKSNLAK